MAYAHYGCTSFVFEKGEPRKMRYCVDYQEKEKPEYLMLLTDAGWSLEYKSSGYYIWRKEYDNNERPELFTDTDSLIRRNSMILGSMTAIFAAQIPIFVVNIKSVNGESPVSLVVMIVWALAAALLAGVSIGMALGISRMKRRAGLKGK